MKNVFEIVRLEQIFLPLHPDVPSALAALKVPNDERERRMLLACTRSTYPLQAFASGLRAAFRSEGLAACRPCSIRYGSRSASPPMPTVALANFLLGIVLAMEGAGQFEKLGATDLVASLVTFSILREIGPLITAVIVIGRSGSAITAELGTMKVEEEIEALNVMGIDPVKYTSSAASLCSR